MRHLQLFLVLACFSARTTAQEGTFLFIQKDYEVNGHYLLDCADFARFEKQIRIDSTKIDRRGSFLVCKVSDRSTVTERFNLIDSSGLQLGAAAGALKPVDLYGGISVEYPFALLIADSLRRSGAYFYTSPPLSEPLRYELSFVGWHNIPFDKQKTPYEEQRRLAEPAFLQFREAFLNEFAAEYGSENIRIFSMMPGHVEVFVELASPDFDLQRLHKLGITFEHKPKVRFRLYDFLILEE